MLRIAKISFRYYRNESYTFRPSKEPQKLKSIGVMSGERGGHKIGPFVVI